VTNRKLFKLVDLIFFLVISLGFDLMPQVDNFANVDRLTTGFLLGLVLLKNPHLRRRHLSRSWPRYV
jgi:membrane associated rhomboid family serine protease